MNKIMTGIIGGISGTIVGTVAGAYVADKLSENKGADYSKRYEHNYIVLNQWLILYQEGRKLSEYLVEQGYKKVAIYGMSELGNRLYDDLKDSEVEVCCAIDREADFIYNKLEVVHPDYLEEVACMRECDAIIVTAVLWYEEIKEEIKEKVSCPILSLKDVVYDA